MQEIELPKGVLVLDIGAGVSDISLLSCNGIVMSKSLRVAGNDLDEAIIEYFKANKRILISHNDAEHLKKELGNLINREEVTMQINVKNLVSRLPERFVASSHVIDSDIVIYLALLGIVFNFISVLLIQKDAKENLNMKAAYLHLLSDTMTSVAVLLGGLGMKYFGAYWIDPLITIAIALYLILTSFSLIKETTAILMQFSPKGLHGRSFH